VVEGILLFASPEIWELLDFRVFRNCPEEIRFGRRTERDVADRGRTWASIEAQLMATVKPMHDRFVQPHASRADFVTEHGQSLTDVTDQLVERLSRLAPGLASREGSRR
jgi:uridine kinase